MSFIEVPFVDFYFDGLKKSPIYCNLIVIVLQGLLKENVSLLRVTLVPLKESFGIEQQTVLTVKQLLCLLNVVMAFWQLSKTERALDEQHPD